MFPSNPYHNLSIPVKETSRFLNDVQVFETHPKPLDFGPGITYDRGVTRSQGSPGTRTRRSDMTAQTTSARQVARMVSKAVGRDITDKRVRQWVRDNVASFDDDGYTTHAYDARTVKVIVAGMTKRYKDSGRPQSASNGRQGATTPAKRKATRKATPAPEATDAPDA